MPDASAQEIEIFSRNQLDWASGPKAAELLRLACAMNAVDVLASVRAETLIIHRREDRLMPFEAGRRLAAGLPQARFMTLEGKAHPPWVDGQVIADIVHSFLAGEDPHPPASSPEFPTGRAIDCRLTRPIANLSWRASASLSRRWNTA
jgi:pimeloyl-ACP methyl ester carboxylesterase